MEITGTYDEDGIFIAENKSVFRNWLSKNANQKVVVQIKRWRKNRSYNQNAYYFGVVIKTICDFTGDEADDMHELLKYKFNPKFMKDGTRVGGSTKKLTTVEFEEYLEKVRQFYLIEYNVRIQLPNEAI